MKPELIVPDPASEVFSQISKDSEAKQNSSLISKEGEGEDDQEINVIVEERSNDFTNRKYNEKHTP